MPTNEDLKYLENVDQEPFNEWGNVNATCIKGNKTSKLSNQSCFENYYI